MEVRECGHVSIEINPWSMLSPNGMFRTYRTNGASPVHAGYWNNLMPPFVRQSVEKKTLGNKEQHMLVLCE